MVFLQKCKKMRTAAVKTAAVLIVGGPERDRTVDLTDANQHPKLFSIISGRFWPFPLRSTSSLSLFDYAVSVWSETVCGGFCGQKRSPALAGVFRRQGRGAFFMPLTAYIVPLWTGLSKSFLCRPWLRNWGTVNKNKHGPIKIRPLAYPGVPGLDPADHKPPQ